MPITAFAGWASVQSALPYTHPLELGAGWEPGDLRLFLLTVSSSRSFSGIPSGWTTLHNATGGSRTIAVIARELVSGDSDPSVTVAGSAGINIGYLGVTLRGADNAEALGARPALASGSSTNVTAPSVATGAGLLVTAHWITRTNGQADTGSWSVPSGMTARASSMSDGPNGYNVLVATEERTSGNSGTRAAGAPSSGSWDAASLFVPEAATAPGGTSAWFHALA